MHICETWRHAVFSLYFTTVSQRTGTASLGKNVLRMHKVHCCPLCLFFDHVAINGLYREAINMLPMETVCQVLINCMTHKVLQHRENGFLCSRLRYREASLSYSSKSGAKGKAYLLWPNYVQYSPGDLTNILSTIRFKKSLTNML